jgi:hypothetical protein
MPSGATTGSDGGAPSTKTSDTHGYKKGVDNPYLPMLECTRRENSPKFFKETPGTTMIIMINNTPTSIRSAADGFGLPCRSASTARE